MDDEALALFKIFEATALTREEIDPQAEIIARNAHRFQILTLKVGPNAGKCLIWLECECERPLEHLCSAIQYN